MSVCYISKEESYTRRFPVQGKGQISFILQHPIAYLDQDFAHTVYLLVAIMNDSLVYVSDLDQLRITS